jgi:Zn-dependent metalloprotease
MGLLVVMLFLLVASNGFVPYQGLAQTLPQTRGEAPRRLQDALAGRGHLKRDRATGLVDFVKLDYEAPGSLVVTEATTPPGKSLAFLREQAQAFGLTDPDSQLSLVKTERDLQGALHLTFNQTYRGVPVFAGVIKAHLDPAGDLRAVNGLAVPAIELDPVPSRSSEEAAAAALAKVQSESPQASALGVKGSKLYVYRTGMARGVEGQNHLTWEIEMSNSADIREFVYIDAHTGKFVDQITGTHNALNRRVYDGENLRVFPPPNYPSNPFWVEGQAFPTGVLEADTVIATTKDTYDLFKNAFGRDSFDGAGAQMETIFNSGWVVGDGVWNGQLTQFGRGVGIDDVIGHEWTHAYTQYTDNLIYQWQPGALNEAYSDIFGETVDLLNARGLDSPGGLRRDNLCVSFRNPTPLLHVNSPAYLQGDYLAGPAASFGPPFSVTGITGDVVLVDDGVGVPFNLSRTDGCQTPFRNAREVRGNIALIDGTNSGCSFSEKVKNAQLNGAIAAIIADDFAPGGVPGIMLGNDPSITIPSALISYRDGQTLRDPRAGTVNITLKADGAPTDDSYRWLIGEEFYRSGARDMWCPHCNGEPGKISDPEYFCSPVDNGGVHFNSAIPNHAYALLVDGGTYNGQTIQSIGFTKAAHIYFRAMSVYQTPASDFADHAEALEASAADLVGVNLPDLLSGFPSGEVISTVDVEQVHKATLAVELRNPPAQCGFQPLLAKNPPTDACPAPGNTQVTIFSDGFESDPTSRWGISSEPRDPATFLPRDWTWVHQLPDGRPGSGFFAIDPLDDCTSAPPGQVGVLHLESPAILLPRVMLGGPHLSFDHWIATEAGYDGGQVMISVNDGPFRLVARPAFIYNGYNTTLFPAARGYENLYNPRAGQPAFSGNDDGALKGSWGTSIIDLTPYVRSGDRIKLRWDLSTDYCYGTSLGWYVDNVRVYACQP